MYSEVCFRQCRHSPLSKYNTKAMTTYLKVHYPLYLEVIC